VLSGDDRGDEGEVQRVLRAKWGKGRRAGEAIPREIASSSPGSSDQEAQRRTGNINTSSALLSGRRDLHLQRRPAAEVRQGNTHRTSVHADGSRSRVCKKCHEDMDA